MPDYPALGPWPAGVNNILDAQSLQPDMLRSAVNVDIDDTGRVRRRRGYRRVYSGNIEPGTLKRINGATYFVEGGDFKRLNADNTATLMRPAVGAGEMAYLLVNGVVYYTNGSATGRITATVHGGWGVTGPARQPVCTGGTGGTLVAGTYQTAVTYVSVSGEESGTGEAATVTVAENGSISLQAIPQPSGSQTIRIYCSGPDGSTLFHYRDLPAGSTSESIEAPAHLQGKELQSQFMQPPYPGQALAYHNGRIYIASGSTLWFTESLRYGLIRADRDFILYPSEIKIIGAVPDGVYVVADKTYFIQAAEGLETRQVDVLPYSAVPGTLIEIPMSEQVAWVSDRGLVIAGNGGQVENITESRIAMGAHGRGSLMWHEYRGLRQYVATMQSHTPSKYRYSQLHNMQLRALLAGVSSVDAALTVSNLGAVLGATGTMTGNMADA